MSKQILAGATRLFIHCSAPVQIVKVVNTFGELPVIYDTPDKCFWVFTVP